MAERMGHGEKEEIEIVGRIRSGPSKSSPRRARDLRLSNGRRDKVGPVVVPK